MKSFARALRPHGDDRRNRDFTVEFLNNQWAMADALLQAGYITPEVHMDARRGFAEEYLDEIANDPVAYRKARKVVDGECYFDQLREAAGGYDEDNVSPDAAARKRLDAVNTVLSMSVDIEAHARGMDARAYNYLMKE